MVVDSAELYPWKFPGAQVTRRKLPVGDYALVEEERLVAVVERKTRENFLGNVHEIKGLHQQRVIGEIVALHPAVPLVFAGNRKLANVWTQRFFAGVAAALHQDLPELVREPVARFDAEPADGGTDTRVRIAALRELPDAFEFGLLRSRFAEIAETRLRRVLNQLRAEGRLRCEGRGRAARWVRVEAQQP